MKATYPEWVSSDYAASIPADAKGTDSKTGNPYIDEWMPDKNLQQLILKQYKNSTNPVSSPDQITKDWLKNNVLSMNASFITQRTDKSYYENTVNMQSLEGLQYATELRMIYTTPDFNASENWGITSIGKLSDLEALRSLTKFKAIDAEMDSIYDISPLSDKSLVNNITEVINGVQLIYSTQLQQNHIIDASPLKLSIPTSESNTYQFGNQIYIAPEITINPNTTSNYMQSKYIKGVDGVDVS